MAETNPIVFSLICVLFLLQLFISSVDSLECYACSTQKSNRDKCIKTTKQCEEQQDVCITTIKWGLPRYWVPYGDRAFYVWKDCDSRVSCDNKKDIETKYCKRDWYDDWSCVECCSGDLCNNYVTLGTSRVHPHTLIQVMSFVVIGFLTIHIF